MRKKILSHKSLRDFQQFQHQQFFLCALKSKKPFVIRYPKGNAINFDNNLPKVNKINVGTWEILKKGNKWAILAVGSMVEIIMNNYEFIEEGLGFSPHVINARFVKPLDKEMLNSIANNFNGIFKDYCILSFFKILL